MFVSMHMMALAVNDALLIALKKISDKYATSECRSQCGNWYWSVRKSKTNESLS